MIHKNRVNEGSRPTIYKIILPLILIVITMQAHAESPYKKSIYNAFITHDMGKWESAIHSMETSEPMSTVDQKLELISYYYGYIGWMIGKKQFTKAEMFIPKGEKLINDVLKVSPKNATAYSFKGSFLGFKIGIDKCKALFLGSDSKNCINKAMALDPLNVQAIVDKGNLLYYAPYLLGGDKKEALNYFLKGAALMEKNNDTYQNWAYLNLLTMIANAYEKTDRLGEAKLTYEKIMRNEPDIKWVKNGL